MVVLFYRGERNMHLYRMALLHSGENIDIVGLLLSGEKPES